MQDVRMLTEEEISVVAGGQGDHTGTGPGTGQHDGMGWLRKAGQAVVDFLNSIFG